MSPIGWAFSVHIDKLLLSKYFKGLGIGSLLIFQYLTSLAVLPIILIFAPSVLFIKPVYAILIILNSVFSLFWLYPYLFALKKDEASIVAPVFQTIPVFSYILAFIFLHEVLTFQQITAGILVMSGSIILSLEIESGKKRIKKDVLFLILLSSLVIAINALVFKFVALETSFWETAFWEYVGYSLMGFGLLLVPNFRKEALTVFKKNASAALGINLLNELFGTVGNIAMRYASLLAPIAATQVVNGFQPLFIFLIGIFLTMFFPKLGQEKITRRHLLHKSLSIALMIIGVYWLV